MFERVKKFYDQRLWKKWQVWEVVSYNTITANEYFLITGELYNPNKRPPLDEVKP